jgi:RNA polymerase sigma-70 factor (ECF subfamily)
MSLDTDRLYEHWPLVLGSIRRQMTGLEDDAEDLAADVFERAVRHAARYEPAEHGPAGLLLVIARRCVMDYHRRRRLRTIVALDDVARCRGTRDAGSERHADEIDVRAATAVLPPRDRMIVALRSEGRDYAEISAVVGGSKSSALRRHRAAVVALGLSLRGVTP